MMQVRRFVLIAALALLILPATAQAQSWFISPYVGGNFGGSADFGDFADDDDEVERRLTFGGTIGWNPNVLGFEIDLGYSPNFFEDTAGDRNFDFGDNNVTTIMGNLLLSAKPGSGFRPYASAGVGLIRSKVDSATSLFDGLTTNDLGLNVGAGINAQFNDMFGIRGDIRYFRSLQDDREDNDIDDFDLGEFNFWRGTVGITFRFGQ